MDFATLQDITILSKGSLLADKATTMARRTIGLKPTRKTEIAKQLYDMAVLLRSASRDDLQTVYDSYARMTGFKASCFRRNPPYTVAEITSDMATSVRGLLSFNNAVTVTDEQNGRYKDFCGSYISKLRPYRKTEHVTDVLLAYLLSLSLQRHSARPESAGAGVGVPEGPSEVDFMYGVLGGMSAIRRSSQERMGRRRADEDHMMRTEYIQDIPDSFVNKKILKGASTEHVLLTRALSGIAPPLAS